MPFNWTQRGRSTSIRATEARNISAVAVAIAASPLTYIMFGLVGLSALLSRLGYRTLTMGMPALLALAMYFVSSVLIMSHRLVEVEHKIAVYEHALFIDGALYLGIALLLRVRVPVVLIMALWVVLAFGGAAALDHRESQKWFWVYQISGVAILAWVCFGALKPNDYVGFILWLILAAGETTSVLQVMGCQIWGNLLHAPEGIGSACERHYGMMMAWIPYIITTAILLWVFIRWHWPRRT